MSVSSSSSSSTPFPVRAGRYFLARDVCNCRTGWRQVVDAKKSAFCGWRETRRRRVGDLRTDFDEGELLRENICDVLETQ